MSESIMPLWDCRLATKTMFFFNLRYVYYRMRTCSCLIYLQLQLHVHMKMFLKKLNNI